MIEDENINEKIEELRILENRLQQLIAQKQSNQIQLNEVNNALEETEKSDDEVYKILAGVMVKSSKEKIRKELVEKQKILEAMILSVEKQEKLVEKNASELRKSIEKNLKSEKEKRN